MANETAEELFASVEDDIIRIKRRLAYLMPLSAELELRAGAPQFPVRNDIVYQMFEDSYDMVVIDLASLSRGMMAAGGFFNRLNNHLRLLKRPALMDINVPAGVQGMEEHFRTSVKDSIDAAFDRLFPDVVIRERAASRPRWWHRYTKRPPSKVTQANTQALKNRFETIAEAVIRDRDARRAHRYERRRADKRTQMLGLNEIAQQFEKVEKVLNDLRLVALRSSFVYEPPLFANKQKTAEHLTDLILMGGIWHILHFFGVEQALSASPGAPFRNYYQYRDAFYAKKN